MAVKGLMHLSFSMMLTHEHELKKKKKKKDQGTVRNFFHLPGYRCTTKLLPGDSTTVTSQNVVRGVTLAGYRTVQAR